MSPLTLLMHSRTAKAPGEQAKDVLLTIATARQNWLRELSQSYSPQRHIVRQLVEKWITARP
jgi:hypothetical protein